MDPKTVNPMSRCGVCMRGNSTSTHSTRRCLLLATLNKHREKKQLLPITVQVNRLLTDAKKKPLTLEALEKKHAQELRDLRSKIGMTLILSRT